MKEYFLNLHMSVGHSHSLIVLDETPIFFFIKFGKNRSFSFFNLSFGFSGTLLKQQFSVFFSSNIYAAHPQKNSAAV